MIVDASPIPISPLDGRARWALLRGPIDDDGVRRRAGYWAHQISVGSEGGNRFQLGLPA